MKRLIFLLLLTFFCCQVKADSPPVRIRGVECSEPCSPVFLNEDGEETVLVSGMDVDFSGEKKWFRIAVFYDTEPEWIDRLTIAVAVRFPGEQGNQTVFRNAIRYVDIPAGREHCCEMFLHFNTYARYYRQGRIQYATVIQIDGKTVASKTGGGGKPGWWMRNENDWRPLLRRDQTPFLLFNADRHEAFEPAAETTP